MNACPLHGRAGWRLLLLLAVSACWLAASFAWATDDAPRLRVMSYNIHHGAGTDGKLDLERIAAVIHAAAPDVVALQEVDSGVDRTDGVDQPLRLSALTGMAAVFGDNIPFQGGRYGNALLSRLPIERHANHPLPSHYDGEQRGVLEVWLKPTDRTPRLRVLATHFDYRPNSTERLASARFVNGLLGDPPADTLTLLAGDLNAQPDSPALRLLDERWRAANEEPAFTFPAAEPTRQIDHVLLSKSSRWRAMAFRVLDEAVASDHRAIVAEFAPL